MASLKKYRESLLPIVNVVLRVPSLFIADAWSQTDPETVHARWILVFTKDSKLVEESHLRHMVILTQLLYYSTLLLVLSLILLPLNKLLRLYSCTLSAALLLFANFLSAHFVQEENDSPMLFEIESLRHIFMYMMLQFVIAVLGSHLLGIGQHTSAKSVMLIYSLPLVARLLGMPGSELHRIHHASATFMLLLSALFLFNQLPLAVETAKTGLHYASSAIRVYGLLQFLMAIWIQMLLPLQFFIFWVILFAAQMYRYMEAGDHPVWREGFPVVLLAGVAESCSSPLTFLGACVTVTYLSKVIIRLFNIYLHGFSKSHNQNEAHYGLAEGITMFILGIQTGLVDLKTAERMFLLSIVLFIVISSLVQSLFEFTEPILLSLAASQNRNMAKHVRTVLLSMSLWLLPLYMTVWICRIFELDFWLLVVISSCILTSVQVLGALFVYGLLIFDSIRSHPSENLDDVIYYTKCLTRVLEFIVAVFVVGYGIERSLLGNWNWLNSSILIVHCYYNVWLRLQSGWNSFLQRRDAIKQLNCMRMATDSELKQHDDICAICHQEMLSARITSCWHFFHSVCLKKWLFIQDYCPICHKKILNVPVKNSSVDPTEDPTSEPSNRDALSQSLPENIGDNQINGISDGFLNANFEPETHASLSSAINDLQHSMTMPENIQPIRIIAPVAITTCLTTTSGDFQTSEVEACRTTIPLECLTLEQNSYISPELQKK